MDYYLLIAAILLLVLGIAHSVIGEKMIFKSPEVKLPKKFRGVLWGAWHIGSITGGCLGLILLYWACGSVWNFNYLISFIAFCMLSSSLLIAISTKAKHPAWIVFLIVSILLILAIL